MSKAQQPAKDTGRIRVQDVSFETSEVDVDAPPPKIKKFNSLADWLNNICDGTAPAKPIQQYCIGMFESTGKYVLCLVGKNEYHLSNDNSKVLIDYQPVNAYFELPKEYFQGLDRNQIIEKLTTDLKKFTATEKFKNSFLAKAERFKIEMTGEVIFGKKD